MITNGNFTKRQTAICPKAKFGNSVLKCLILLVTCTIITPVMAQEDKGFFNSLTIGASVGTTGIGFDAATPIGNLFVLRAGIDMMPNFSFRASTSADIPYQDIDYPSDIKVEGAFKRTSGNILLNIYFSKRGKFFLCGGVYFGGSQLLSIKAHTDNEDLLELLREGKDVGIEIGDYHLPIDKNGNISGGLNVSSFRPYIGIGRGRVVPQRRIGITYEVGIQIQKAPKIFSNYGDISNLTEGADDSFKDIMNIFKVYPVFKLRLCGKIF